MTICKRRLAGLVLSALAAGSVLAEQAAPPAPIPNTPAGRRLADLLRLTATGDEADIASYVREHFTESMKKTSATDPGIVPFLVQHRKRGGFEAVREIASTEHHVTMLVRPRAQPDRRLRYVLTVEAEPPHRVEGLFLMAASPHEVPPPTATLSSDEAVAAFTREVERIVAAGSFSGVVLLARGEQVVLQRAAGEANREHHVAVGLDTVFGLASMNKMFTAVAIGRLVEQGRLAFDDPVGRHLRGWLADEPASKITVAQLLTHTSGLGDYLQRIPDDPRIRNARSLSDYRELVQASSIEGPPDAGLRYSNTGYVVLGALIEAVSGRDYYEFVREEIYSRAGMLQSDSWDRDQVVEHRATGYLPPEDADAAGLGRAWRSNESQLGARGTSAGGGYATALDLFRFARALVEGRLVRRETLDELLVPRVRFPAGGHYGYGFVVQVGGPFGRVFGHAGGFPGVSGELKVYGDGVWTLVVVSNVSGGGSEIATTWDALAARVR